MKRGLQPLVPDGAHILVLGSLPSDKSIAAQQYYAHPRNQFWRILGALYDDDFVTQGYEERVRLLGVHGIALWDVLESAERDGSADSAISNPVSNDIGGLLAAHPDIDLVLLNGGAAADYFRRYVSSSLEPERLRIEKVPSSSPIPGRNVLPLEGKVERWRTAMVVY